MAAVNAIYHSANIISGLFGFSLSFDILPIQLFSISQMLVIRKNSNPIAMILNINMNDMSNFHVLYDSLSSKLYRRTS